MIEKKYGRHYVDWAFDDLGTDAPFKDIEQQALDFLVVTRGCIIIFEEFDE